MSAEEFIDELEKISLIIKNKEDEIEELKTREKDISAPEFRERVQSSGSKQKQADNIDTRVDLEREVAELWKKRNKLIKIIERLKAKEYDVIYKAHLKNWTYKEIALEHGKSISWVSTTHQRAMEHLNKMLGDE